MPPLEAMAIRSIRPSKAMIFFRRITDRSVHSGEVGGVGGMSRVSGIPSKWVTDRFRLPRLGSSKRVARVGCVV